MNPVLKSSKDNNENLINEYKGNLFEYLFGIQLARHWSIELNYIKSIPPYFAKQLSDYELFLRENDPSLVSNLIGSSIEAKTHFLKSYNIPVKMIHIMGKLTSPEQRSVIGEGDVIVEFFNSQHVSLSLKYGKAEAYINTKSAGIKSFFTQYFGEFEVIDIQNKFNNEIDFYFDLMARKIHENHQMVYVGNFKEWTEIGLPDLPGQLDGEDRIILKELYYELIFKIYNNLTSLYKLDEQKFSRSLLALLGISNSTVVQLFCSYSKTNNKIFLLDENFYLDALESVQFSAPKSGQASFEIILKTLNLQIRVKPMNKFTTPSYKINCSIKLSVDKSF